jgi:adenylate cyclase
MGKYLRFTKNDFISLMISLLVFIVLASTLLLTTLFDRMENGSVDFRYFLRDPSERSKKLQEGVRINHKNPRANKDIVILGIDEVTIREFDSQGIQWPFPWTVHAKFTDFVGSGNPNSIFFDIMFLDHKKGQEELAAAIGRSGCSFLDFPFETEESDKKYPDIEERLTNIEKLRFPIDPEDTAPAWAEEAVPPNPLLSAKAKGTGFANVRPDPTDHVNRRMPLLIKYKGFYYPSIDLSVTMNYFGIGINDVEIKMGSYVKLKNLPAEKMAKPNADRSIIIPVDKEGFMDINFIGAVGSFPFYSYYYFHNDGSLNNDSLKGKICLVAAYASTGIATDVHKSPYGDLFGIEHHANAINTIINQDFINKLTDIENVLIMLFIALLLGYLLPRLSIPGTIIVTAVMMIGYTLTGYFVFDTKNIIISFTPPLMLIAVDFAMIIALRVITEQKEKRYIRQTFSKFVSKSVVDDLLKHPEKLKLGGDKKILTVLFSDIRGFTTISEKLTPEQLVEHLNEYLQAMTDIVMKYNGTLDKYVGDEIMAFWGAPIPQDDHAYLACKGSLDMIADLVKMNAHWDSIGKPRLEIGIGLNSGDMVVGNMGSTSRMDYTLMGDNVNLGARLEGTNKIYGTRIIISEFTYELVKDLVIVRELDLIRVKGKHLPVKIYELVDLVENQIS